MTRGSKIRVGCFSGFLMLAVLAAAAGLATPVAEAATIRSRPLAGRSRSQVSESSRARRRMSRLRQSRRAAASSSLHRTRTRRHRYYERFKTSSFAQDITDGDNAAGEDAVVRAAAVEALGNMNGTVVAIEPNSGRILAMVNQKLALSAGAQPCSTIKVPVALAAISEGIVDKDTSISLGRRWSMNLTQALAYSNNAYFEAIGRKLGFERVYRYARMFGLGELAGYQIDGEQPGVYPAHEISARLGGVGKMCSFGEGISMTPLQLGSLVSAMANGGTLYYLQHPETPEELTTFEPRIKRQLKIGNAVAEMTDGMLGAVHYGTARRLRLDFSEEEVMGKTGTCSHAGTRFGWFASYAKTDAGDVVVVVFLRGGRPTFGPKAAEIAGRMYQNLYAHSYFTAREAPPEVVPAAAVIR